MTVTCISQHWGLDDKSELIVNHNDETDVVSVTTTVKIPSERGCIEREATIHLNRAQFGMLICNSKDALIDELAIEDIRQLIIKGILLDKGFGSIDPERLLLRLSENGARDTIDRRHAIAIVDAYRSPTDDNEGLDSLIEDLKVLEAL